MSLTKNYQSHSTYRKIIKSNNRYLHGRMLLLPGSNRAVNHVKVISSYCYNGNY